MDVRKVMALDIIEEHPDQNTTNILMVGMENLLQGYAAY